MSDEIDDEGDDVIAADEFEDDEFEVEEPDEFEVEEPDDFDVEPDDVVGEVDLEAELDLDEPLDDYVVSEDVEVDVVEEEEEPVPATRTRKVADDDDDEEEQDPDDIEADLEAILRDRMAAMDEDDDEDSDEAGLGAELDVPPGPRNDEFVCASCFLLVNRSQFGSAKDPRCPMGEPECPSIARIFGS